MDNDELKKLIDSTDMVALVSPYTKLTKAGANYKGLCPFHKEDTPSFMVNQEKKMAHCFGCGKGGNPIQFLMDIKHIDFKEAVVELAKINKFKLTNFSFNANPINKLNQKYYEINKLAMEVYERYLYNSESGKKALNYLYDRGLSDEDIKTFHIGLAPSEGHVLYNILKDNNYIELDLVELNLIRSTSNGYLDVFTNRIIFPILDEKGNVTGFSGRILTNNKNEPKYLNTSDTKIFKKNLILYNLNNAIKSINTTNRVIIYEGFMDVIASTRANLGEAVCSMGTQLTSNQIKLIKRYTNNVIVAFDSDSAGLLATQRASQMFVREGMNVKYLLLDKCKDPDEYVHTLGKDAYYNYFNNNILNYYEYMYRVVTKDINLTDPIMLDNAKNKLFSILYESRSEIIISEFIGKFAKYVGIEAHLLRKEYDLKYQNSNRVVDNEYVEVSYQEPIINKPVKKQGFILSEARLFNYATSSKKYANKIDDFINENNIRFSNDNELSNIWLTLYSEYYKIYNDYDESKFVKLLEDKDISSNGTLNTVKRFTELQDFLHMNSLNFPYSEEDLLNNLNDKKRRNYLRNERKDLSNKNLSIEQAKVLLNNHLRNLKHNKGGQR